MFQLANSKYFNPMDYLMANIVVAPITCRDRDKGMGPSERDPGKGVM